MFTIKEMIELRKLIAEANNTASGSKSLARMQLKKGFEKITSRNTAKGLNSYQRMHMWVNDQLLDSVKLAIKVGKIHPIRNLGFFHAEEIVAVADDVEREKLVERVYTATTSEDTKKLLDECLGDLKLTGLLDTLMKLRGKKTITVSGRVSISTYHYLRYLELENTPDINELVELGIDELFSRGIDT